MISPERVEFIKAEVVRAGHATSRPKVNAFFVPEGFAASLQIWTHLQPRNEEGRVPMSGDVTTYHQLLRVLKGCGFWVGWDRHWGKKKRGTQYQCFWHSTRRTHHQGGWGRLRFHSSVSGLHTEFKFYFDGYTENPNGPRYGFDHLRHMDHWTRLRMQYAIGKLSEMLRAAGFVDTTKERIEDPYERIEYAVRDSWHFQGEASIFEPRKTESYNDRDANGRRLVNGERRYFYDYMTGRLVRGEVFYNLNNMWWVVAGGELRNCASHQLFDCDLAVTPRRDPARALPAVKRLLAAAVAAEDFKRAEHLRKRRDDLIRLAAAAQPHSRRAA